MPTKDGPRHAWPKSRQCRQCRRWVNERKDGTLRRHGKLTGWGLCDGR